MKIPFIADTVRHADLIVAVCAGLFPIFIQCQQGVQPTNAGYSEKGIGAFAAKMRNNDPVYVAIIGNSVGCGFMADNTFVPNPYNSESWGLLANGFDMTSSRLTNEGQYDTRINSWPIQVLNYLKNRNSLSAIYNLSGNGYATWNHIQYKSVSCLADKIPKPDIVVIPLQINDASHSLEIWAQNTTALIDDIRAHGMSPVIMKENDIDPIDIVGINGMDTVTQSIPARPWFYDIMNSVDTFAEIENVPVIDAFAITHPLMQKAGIGNYAGSGYLHDFVHPNQHGHDLMFSVVKCWLDSISVR